jgi:hypothetical protein
MASEPSPPAPGCAASVTSGQACSRRARRGSRAPAEDARLLLEQPATALVDADEDGLEAPTIEGLDDEAGREEGDLVLGGATTEEHGDAEFLLG